MTLLGAVLKAGATGQLSVLRRRTVGTMSACVKTTQCATVSHSTSRKRLCKYFRRTLAHFETRFHQRLSGPLCFNNHVELKSTKVNEN